MTSEIAPNEAEVTVLAHHSLLLPATEEGLDAAVALLANGDVVAFPTETVYGLGANALDAKAVITLYIKFTCS